MPVEGIRGCGYRQVGKLYLVGEGLTVACDRLPFELGECPCCGFRPRHQTGFRWLHRDYLGGDHEGCKDEFPCPVCYPTKLPEERLHEGRFGFMWVGKRYYTPQSFVKEAGEMGVSKAISQIPKGLVIGETWVLLAHKAVPIYDAGTFENGLAKQEPRKAPAIFYAFVPQRVEMLVWKSEATEERVLELEERGITVIVVPDGDEAHAKGHKKAKKQRTKKPKEAE